MKWTMLIITLVFGWLASVHQMMIFALLWKHQNINLHEYNIIWNWAELALGVFTLGLLTVTIGYILHHLAFSKKYRRKILKARYSRR